MALLSVGDCSHSENDPALLKALARPSDVDVRYLRVRQMRIGLAGPVNIRSLKGFLREGETSADDLPLGLGGTPVTILALELLRRGLALEIFTLDRSVGSELMLEGDRLRLHVGPYRSARRARDLFRVEREFMRRAIQRSPVTLVHAHWTYEFALAALESGVPTVVTAHDAPLRVLALDRSPYRLLRTYMAARALKQTNVLTAVSPYVADHIQRFFGFRKPINVIPNPISPELFRLGNGATRSPRHGITYVTVMNGWSALKNPQVTIKAFSHVRAKVPGAKLLMIGSGYGPGEQAERWTRLRGLDTDITFIGSLPPEEVMRLVATDVDVLVHTSLEESFSMVIAEAFAAGIPVIAGCYSGAVPWVVGDAGVLVDIRRINSVADAMIALAEQPSERERLGRAGHSRAEQHFRASTVADLYLSQYTSVLAGGV